MEAGDEGRAEGAVEAGEDGAKDASEAAKGGEGLAEVSRSRMTLTRWSSLDWRSWAHSSMASSYVSSSIVWSMMEFISLGRTMWTKSMQ